ncbi:MAG: protein kinase [Myxococcota bacterium]
MRVGDTIAGYDIVAKMKSGGMAALFLGRRKRAGGFEKHVAIKVVHEHLSEDKEFARMFLDEARISASIEHPNVVHVHDLGHADGRDFLVMEYVPGVAFSQLLRNLAIKERRPTPAVAAWIAMQVAGGLHSAHELTNEVGENLAVVHRDISPKNVLIAYKGYVKLIDFGIAKAAGRIHHTQGSLLKGTFRYMSPEQAMGQAIDRRTDIYALGVMLWESLTLQRLFDAENDILLLDLVRDPKAPPPGSLVAGIPPALDAVVLKALSKNPADRYKTAAEFRQALAMAVPEALAVSQAEIADLVGVAMEGEVEGHEDPSIRSALGYPKQPSGDARQRLTREASQSLLSRGGVALKASTQAHPTLVTPTPHTSSSGIRAAPSPPATAPVSIEESIITIDVRPQHVGTAATAVAPLPVPTAPVPPLSAPPTVVHADSGANFTVPAQAPAPSRARRAGLYALFATMGLGAIAMTVVAVLNLREPEPTATPLAPLQPTSTGAEANAEGEGTDEPGAAQPGATQPGESEAEPRPVEDQTRTTAEAHTADEAPNAEDTDATPDEGSANEGTPEDPPHGDVEERASERRPRMTSSRMRANMSMRRDVLIQTEF